MCLGAAQSEKLWTERTIPKAKRHPDRPHIRYAAYANWVGDLITAADSGHEALAFLVSELRPRHRNGTIGEKYWILLCFSGRAYYSP